MRLESAGRQVNHGCLADWRLRRLRLRLELRCGLLRGDRGRIVLAGHLSQVNPSGASIEGAHRVAPGLAGGRMGDHLRLMMYRIGREVSFEWFEKGSRNGDRGWEPAMFSMGRYQALK